MKKINHSGRSLIFGTLLTSNKIVSDKRTLVDFFKNKRCNSEIMFKLPKTTHFVNFFITKKEWEVVGFYKKWNYRVEIKFMYQYHLNDNMSFHFHSNVLSVFCSSPSNFLPCLVWKHSRVRDDNGASSNPHRPPVTLLDENKSHTLLIFV